METVGSAILYVMKVHRNAIRQGIILAAMRKSNHVETPESFVSAQVVLIIELNLEKLAV